MPEEEGAGASGSCDPACVLSITLLLFWFWGHPRGTQGSLLAMLREPDVVMGTGSESRPTLPSH